MKRALIVQSNEKSANLVSEALSEMFAIEFVHDYEKAYGLTTDSYFDVLICAVDDATFDDAAKLVSTLKKIDHYTHSQIFILS